MKKITVVLLLGALMLAVFSGCLPVDGEPERIGAGMAGGADEPYEPETIEGWGEGVNSFGAYSWNGALLEEVTKELGLGYSQLCWIDDQTVTAVFGEDVFADGACYDGVFRFTFSSRQDGSELAAAAGLSEDELRLWAREWSWPDYRYMARGWELAVTYEPLPEGRWVTPSWWLPPQGLTGKGEDRYGYWDERALAGPYDEDGNPIPTPEPTPFPEDRQAVEDFRFPGWEPLEGHEGYEISTVHSTADGRPLQVRLRWKNEEGYGFWAQLPAHALESFWEHEGEWFVMVGVNTDGEYSGPESGEDDLSIEEESSMSSTIHRHNEDGTEDVIEVPAD